MVFEFYVNSRGVGSFDPTLNKNKPFSKNGIRVLCEFGFYETDQRPNCIIKL